MRTLQNENGIALVTSLLLTMISLAFVLALLYVVTQGTKMSGAQKRYRNALEASHGGVEVMTKEIIPKLFTGYSSNKLATDFSTINLAVSSSVTCMQQKMTLTNGHWSACSVNSSSLDPKVGYDLTFRLQNISGQPGFRVYAKIVDTSPGNSDASGIDYLDSGGGVASSSPGVSPKHLPGMYRLEVQGEREVNPEEKAKLSVMYAY